TGESLWPLTCQALECCRRGWSVRVVVHHFTERFARAEDVRVGYRGATFRLGEEITAEQRPCLQLHHESAFPAVGHVWRVEPAQDVLADPQLLAIGKGAGGSGGNVVHRHHGCDLAAHWHCAGRGSEELVERATFVGLVM